MASILGVSPGAIEITNVADVIQNVFGGRRRRLAATDSKIKIDFKVELTHFQETDDVMNALVTIDANRIAEIQNTLINFGLTNTTEIVAPTTAVFVTLAPPPPPPSPPPSPPPRSSRQAAPSSTPARASTTPTTARRLRARSRARTMCARWPSSTACR